MYFKLLLTQTIIITNSFNEKEMLSFSEKEMISFKRAICI